MFLLGGCAFLDPLQGIVFLSGHNNPIVKANLDFVRVRVLPTQKKHPRLQYCLRGWSCIVTTVKIAYKGVMV